MDSCLTPADMDGLIRDILDPEIRARVASHLQRCDSCHSKYQERCDELFLADARPILDSIMDTAQTHSVPGNGPAPHVHLPRIEGYDVIRLIGRGGMAAVYEAIQLKLNRRVALKLLPAVAGSAQPSLVSRFKREATAAASLHHTNIVPIYDFGESRDGYYYAMELIHGLSLREMIRRLAAVNAPDVSASMLAALVQDSDFSSVELPASDSGESVHSGSTASGGTTSSLGRNRTYYRQIAQWIADVAGALHYAHVCGVIHRDIKPGNLILSTDGRIMVADFGLAKTTGEDTLTLSGSLAGTYRYMSPEQIAAGRAGVDARTDVYSLGVTLYEVLTYQPAFPASEREDLFNQIMFKEPTLPRKVVSTVPVELQTICLKSMDKKPHARYANAQELADDLQRYIDDLPIVARPTGMVGRARKFVARRPALSAFMCLLLVSGITTTWLVYSRSMLHRQATEADSAKVAALLNQADAAGKEGRFSEARDSYHEVLAAEPINLRALYGLANVEKELFYRSDDGSHLDTSEELIKRGLAVADNPYRSSFLNFMIVIHRNRKDYALAAKVAEQVTEMDPTNYAPWCNLGFMYVLMDDFDKAEDAWQKSMNKAGEANVSMTWCNLGALRIHRNDPAAAQALAPAYERNPQDVNTLLHMARMHLEVDELRDSRQALQFAYAADTIHTQANNARVKRVVALAELANENWQDAVDAAEQALELDDRPEAFAHGVLAIAYGRLNEPKKSAAELQKLYDTWPEEMRERGYFADQLGKTFVWIDSNRVLEQLRSMALGLAD